MQAIAATILLSAIFQPIDTPAKEIAPEVVEAWEKAGAQLYWSIADPSGVILVDYSEKRTGLPGFIVLKKLQNISALPAPDVPFGLSLYDTKLANDTIDCLCKMQNLRWLGLGK